MVNAEGIKIFAHLGEAFAPPSESVGGHGVPIIRREAPVLAFAGKVVGRGSGLHPQVEELREDPGVDAIRGDSDWDIALEGNSAAAAIVSGLEELAMEMILEEEMELHLGARLVVVEEVDDAGCRELGVVAPLAEVGGAIFIAEGRESGIGDEPGIISVEEAVKFRAGEGFVAFLIENGPCIGNLGGHNPLIVNVREGLKLLALQLKVVSRCFIADASEFFKAEVEGMEGYGRVGVVGVRVRPGVGHGGVVDRENLDDAHLPVGGPVGHEFEVFKVTDSEVVGAAEGEHGDGHSGSVPFFASAEVERPGIGQGAVRPFLPDYFFAAADDELIFQVRGEGVGHSSRIEREGTGGIHADAVARGPVSQFGT